MRDLIHTGDSANIAFYIESGPQRPRKVWAEILRSAKPWPGGKPVFYAIVYREGVGEVVRHAYRPRRPVAAGPLDDKAATRLVRRALMREEAGK